MHTAHNTFHGFCDFARMHPFTSCSQVFLKEGKGRIWKEKKECVLEFFNGRKGNDLEGFGGIIHPYFLLKVILPKVR